MDAKKARGGGSKRAICVAFKAFGLDPKNQDHWDTLLGMLARARPKKGRGRPQKWTEAEVAKFNERVLSLQMASLIETTDWDAVADAFVASYAAWVRDGDALQPRKEPHKATVEVVKAYEEALANPQGRTELVAALRAYFAKMTNDAEISEVAEVRAAQRASELRLGPGVFGARVIAMVLRQQGLYRHMTEESLTKYVISGPVRTRGGK